MTFAPISLTYQLEKRTSWLKEAFIVVGASILISLFAQVSIPLPFTPVPITLQCHMILLIAAVLGSKRGALATMAYLTQGMLGLPVFAGGKAGILCLAGPTGGYLVGYVAAAFLTGYLVERMKEKSSARVLLAMAAGNGLIYLTGISWLSTFVGWTSAFMLGVVPFIVGDMVKLFIAIKAMKTLRFLSR